jgi:rhamnose transport system ATP-binding protein
MTAPVLQLAGIKKSFGGTRALTDGALTLHSSHVTALIGENGAGKSTLVKILTGVERPDSGEILLDGRTVHISSPQVAQRLGISAIHQESVLFDDLSVAENIFVSSWPRRGLRIDWRSLNTRAAALLAQLEATIDPRTPLSRLSVAQKHLVQIARALSHDARIVIMDEPTAALSRHEANDVLRIARRLREAGRAVLFISHRFEEVFGVADRYCVFRDGAAVNEGAIAATNVDELIHLMVGRSLEQAFPEKSARIAEDVLRVEGLSREPEYADIGFSVRSGEILGIYGLVGAGRSEVMKTLFGLNRPDRGRVTLAGEPLHLKDSQDAIAKGIAYVPEDRQHQGAILSRSIAANIALPNLPRFSKRGFLQSKSQQRVADEWVARLQIKCAAVDQSVGDLSGGNQQKVVLAKWLLTKPRVLILDEPTKGIDVGAKAKVHELIGAFATQGIAVVLVSSELPEILGMSDRVFVMRRGRGRGEFLRSTTTAEDILRAATDA